ncbi:MAG: glutamine--fructose-6-phosphate transaminase (isomerizing) [Deltaproteobacteria bacterium]|nr:glutamine--fructose-6-phosphate transaminase (isomerizing) [Deltaproteobacteria bacterium]
MCGIVGYIGEQQASDILIPSLKKLEYRGYDSAGVAILGDDGFLHLRRRAGKLINLDTSLHEEPIKGILGIGHTRWATHGPPSERNAHPHQVGGIAVVHNGIIENHAELRNELKALGADIQSDTDTELVAHLIDREIRQGAAFHEAIRKAVARIEGVYALAVTSKDHADELVAIRKSSPLIVGLGDGENFLASDVPAIIKYTNKVIYLEDGDFAVLRREGVTIYDMKGDEQKRMPKTIQWNPVAAEKEGHKHFMHKEIFEQPRSLISAVEGRINVEEANVQFPDSGLEMIDAREVQRVMLIACGTAWHAASIGRLYIEALSGIPCEVDLASEFRYRDPIVPPGSVCIVVSQSGETADTLAALREAKRLGAKSIAVCNVPESSIARTADAVCYTNAGPEIGVASTKAFVTQVAVLFLLGVWFGRRNGRLTADEAREHLEEITRMPFRIQEVLAVEDHIREIARWSKGTRGFLFIGRHLNHMIAMEGALKLKEISYLHAEGYAAGEMKHGPIALIDEEMMVIAIAPRMPTYDKMLSNIEEAKARGGKVLAICTRGDTTVATRADQLIEIPPCPPMMVPLLTVIPLQLLAYHIADLQGTDVDQPRNLAKSVTVE